ncbi:uncharacterized protein LOC127130162 [Lathyrus oleraceus]|uniref:uncharacterized protein LOC127130162 n=1 Tax=Pisum sativum TaxID=3888 RepID=UPI0021D3CA71|nr:uncharacterized protein LOC127130162 [Pisum sativum]
MASLPPPIAQTNDIDHYNDKPPVFDGDRFDYYASGNKVERRVMTDQQKKNYKNHHKARTVLLNVISYTEYEIITNRDTAKSIFDYLRMAHEGNSHVKETKALALIQKYEAFKTEGEEIVENMFLRFQTLIAGLKVLNKGYSTTDHVKKIIKSLPKSYRPMITALKLSKDLNNTSLEELVSSLKSREIELEEDEPKRNRKYISLKSSGRSEKTKALQAETDEESEEESEEEDELSLLSRHVNQLWKKRQGKFRGQRRISGRSESTSGSKKVGAGKELTCFECKDPGHFKNECPKLKKERPKKNFRGKKKDSEEVFSKLSRSKLESSLSKVLEKYQNLLDKYKDLKKIHVSESEAYCRLQKDFSSLSEENLILKNNNFRPQCKSLKPKMKIISKVSTGSGDIIKKYDKYFQKFLAKSLNRSLMAPIIYGVSRNETRGIGYDSNDESDSEKEDKPNTLQSFLFGVIPKGKIAYKPKAKAKPHSRFNYAYMYSYLANKPSLLITRRLTPKDLERCGYLKTR